MRESVSRKLGRSFHPGRTTGRSECDWHSMGAYCSHPACQSKPLECFGMFFPSLQTCVYRLVGDRSFVTRHKSVFIFVLTEVHTF